MKELERVISESRLLGPVIASARTFQCTSWWLGVSTKHARSAAAGDVREM